MSGGYVLICAILEVMPLPASRREKRRIRREKPEPQAEILSGKGKNAIYRIKVQARPDGSEWENSGRWLAPFRGRFVLREGDKAPEQVQRWAFSPQKDGAPLLAEAAKQLLTGAESLPKVLGIYDKNIGFLPYIGTFLPLCESIAVYTERKAAWEKEAKAWYAECGAVVTVLTQPDSLHSADAVIVSPAGNGAFSAGKPVLSLVNYRRAAIGVGRLTFSLKAGAPIVVESVPAAAMIAACRGIGQESSVRVETYRFNGREISPQTARALFLQQIPAL